MNDPWTSPLASQKEGREGRSSTDLTSDLSDLSSDRVDSELLLERVEVSDRLWLAVREGKTVGSRGGPAGDLV